jgi:hypothetical protein
MPTSSGLFNSELGCAGGANILPRARFHQSARRSFVLPSPHFLYTTYINTIVIPSPARSSVSKDDGQVWRHPQSCEAKSIGIIINVNSANEYWWHEWLKYGYLRLTRTKRLRPLHLYRFTGCGAVSQRSEDGCDGLL